MNDLKKHQEKAVEALEMFSQICGKHNITFFLLAGTALGAKRHTGFIPWDDDIDIGMKLEDFYKINKILLNEEFKEFEITNYFNHKRFPRFYPKIWFENNHCIDIFPIIKTSNYSFGRKIHRLLGRFIFKLYLVNILTDQIGNPMKKTIANILNKFVSREKTIEWANRNESYFEGKETNYFMNIYSIYDVDKETLKREWVDNLELTLFENDYYYTFKDLHAYLQHLYGDYTTLPPIEERIPQHGSLKEVYEIMNE